jgi:ArsR family transcriptional regulator
MARATAKKTSAPNGRTRARNSRLDIAIRELAQVFKLLSDETRLRILYLLVENEQLNVTALCNELQQSQPAVSHHLALLRVAGIIVARREGKHNFYTVRPEAFDALLIHMLSALGPIPKKLSLDNFNLSYTGR